MAHSACVRADAPACSTGIISLGFVYNWLSRLFPLPSERAKNKQGEMNEKVWWRRKKKPNGVLQGVPAVLFSRWGEQCFNRTGVKLLLSSQGGKKFLESGMLLSVELVLMHIVENSEIGILNIESIHFILLCDNINNISRLCFQNRPPLTSIKCSHSHLGVLHNFFAARLLSAASTERAASR